MSGVITVSEIEAFMAANQFYRCERLSANLTVGQCDANRRRKGEYGKPGLEKIISCEGCAGLGKAVEVQERLVSAKPRKSRKAAAGVNRQIVLDMSGHADLYDWLQECEVTAEHIIELLKESYQGNVRRAA